MTIRQISDAQAANMMAKAFTTVSLGRPQPWGLRTVKVLCDDNRTRNAYVLCGATTGHMIEDIAMVRVGNSFVHAPIVRADDDMMPLTSDPAVAALFHGV